MRQILEVPRRKQVNLVLNERADELENLLSKLFSHLQFYRNKAGRAFLRFAPLPGGRLKRTLYRGLVRCAPLSARLLVQIRFPESGVGSGDGSDHDDRLEAGESGVIVRALFRRKDASKVVGANELLVKRSELQLLLCGKPWLLYAQDVESQIEMCKWISTRLRFEKKKEPAPGARQSSFRLRSPFRLFLSDEIDVGKAATEGLLLSGRRYRIAAKIDETRRGITFSAEPRAGDEEKGAERQKSELLSCTISLEEIRALTGRWPVEMSEPKKAYSNRAVEWASALPSVAAVANAPEGADQRPFTAPGKMRVAGGDAGGGGSGGDGGGDGGASAGAGAAAAAGFITKTSTATTALQTQYEETPPLVELLQRLVVAHGQLKINRDVVTQELRMAGAPVKLVASVHGDNILFVASQVKDEEQELEDIKKVEAEIPKQAKEKISKAVDAIATEHKVELEALEIAFKKEQEEKQLVMEKVEAENTIAEDEIAGLRAAVEAEHEAVRKAEAVVAELEAGIRDDGLSGVGDNSTVAKARKAKIEVLQLEIAMEDIERDLMEATAQRLSMNANDELFAQVVESAIASLTTQQAEKGAALGEARAKLERAYDEAREQELLAKVEAALETDDTVAVCNKVKRAKEELTLATRQKVKQGSILREAQVKARGSAEKQLQVLREMDASIARRVKRHATFAKKVEEEQQKLQSSMVKAEASALGLISNEEVKFSRTFDNADARTFLEGIPGDERPAEEEIEELLKLENRPVLCRRMSSNLKLVVKESLGGGLVEDELDGGELGW